MRSPLRRALARCLVIAVFVGVLWSEARADMAEDHLQASRIIEHGSAANHVRIYAARPRGSDHVVIVPSLGRGVEDYTERYASTLTTRLVEAGYRVVLIQPRGVGESRGDLTPEDASMSMFAQDIRAALDALAIERAHFVGHAFGNRLARTIATLYPSYVDHLVLMASGGNFAMTREQETCLTNSFDLDLKDEERVKFIGCAFFAKGNDPSVWLTGWYPDLAKAQMLAARMINGEFFKKAGEEPFLLIQAAEDFIAPPDRAGRVLARELGDQVTYVEIPDAGHALSSEQPDLIAKHIVDYLRR